RRRFGGAGGHSRAARRCRRAGLARRRSGGPARTRRPGARGPPPRPRTRSLLESGMSIVIRDVQEHELDSILALNNAAGPTILPLDAARIRKFYDSAEYFRVAERDGTLAGFLVGMGSDADHDSSNFHWFRAHCERFFYIDRIVVSSRRRGGGVGRAFYADAQSHAELATRCSPARCSSSTTPVRCACSMAASASTRSAST